jgi:hypothetical protein
MLPALGARAPQVSDRGLYNQLTPAAICAIKNSLCDRRFRRQVCHIRQPAQAKEWRAAEKLPEPRSGGLSERKATSATVLQQPDCGEGR